MEKIQAFLKGIWSGFGRAMSYKLVGPIQVVDFLMLFNIGTGILAGWGNTNALCGWFLAAWFFACLRVMESVGDVDKQAIEDATVALRLAGEAMERQQERIEELEAKTISHN